MTPINGIARKSPRGDLTFVTASDFRAGVKQVVEVVVKDQLELPSGTQFRLTHDNAWVVL